MTRWSSRYLLYISAALLVFAPTLSRAQAPAAVATDGAKPTAGDEVADLPNPITSFGAANVGNQIYAYGGHYGSAHEYSVAGQSDELIRLDLDSPGEWSTVSKGPRLQGLALVAHGNKLYRIGGFTAKNQEGEDHDLWSQSQVACYDLASEQWTDLPELPEPRSSFDAAVMDGKVYVMGGWTMAGDKDSEWLATAYVMDLNADTPQWTALPEPPFQRRALAVAAFDGQIYAIGGMQQKGGPTTRVAIFDPKSGEWSEGPAMPGEGMEGFGAAAFAQNGHLFVSTYGGNLLRLSGDKSEWESAQQLETARFFHRMLPVGKNRLVLFGGANMGTGKFEHVDFVEVK